MKLFLINNDGGGFADHVEVAPGTTINQCFEQPRIPCDAVSASLVRRLG